MRSLPDLARRLNLRARRGGLPPLLWVTDAARLPDPIPEIRRLPPGCAVVLRHYGCAGRRALARAVARECRRRRLVFLVAGDVDLAAGVRADGIHLAEGVARCGGARARLWRRGRKGILSVAAHGMAALARAAGQRADWATLSPVFPTRSHPGAKALGAGEFRRLCRRARLPVYALGGVTAARVAAVRGAAGVATASPLGA